MELLETISIPALLHLMKNTETLIVKEERKKFLNYAQTMLDHGGKMLIKYAPVSHGFGRIYAEKALSVQSMSRFIRNSLCTQEMYHDIDIENCHPILLSFICSKHQISCKKLNLYIMNREDILKFVHKDRAKAKERMLSLIFGSELNEKTTGFVKQFADELVQIAELLFDLYLDIPISNLKNPKFSRMSILLQDMENKALGLISRCLDEHGYRPAVYMYDGLLVYRKGEEKELDLNVLKKCEEEVMEKMEGLKIHLTEKEIKIHS
jgi:hypothetical protein